MSSVSLNRGEFGDTVRLPGPVRYQITRRMTIVSAVGWHGPRQYFYQLGDESDGRFLEVDFGVVSVREIRITSRRVPPPEATFDTQGMPRLTVQGELYTLTTTGMGTLWIDTRNSGQLRWARYYGANRTKVLTVIEDITSGNMTLHVGDVLPTLSVDITRD